MNRVRRHEPGDGAALPRRAQVVIDDVIARLSALERCGHLPGATRMAYWVAVDPGRLLCEFCWGAAQVLASHRDLACGFCGWPVRDPGGDDDAVVLAKLAPGLSAHFWLCAVCASTDLGGA